jgi:hypothetical protein
MVVHLRLKLLCVVLESLWSMNVIHRSVGNYYVFYLKIWSHAHWETCVLGHLYLIICQWYV